MIYGGDEDNNLTHLIRSLRRWPVHALPDGGRMLWQPVFTWDVVAAILAALENPQTIQRDYTLAGPEPVSYAEMVRTILRAAGLRRLLVPVPLGVVMLAARLLACVMSRPPLRPDQVQRMREDKVFDITAARRDLGFDPIPFAEGIRRKLAGEV
jgi:nucleoside-diphosphate-sugar epimerase